jgi:hypothetical protein
MKRMKERKSKKKKIKYEFYIRDGGEEERNDR